MIWDFCELANPGIHEPAVVKGRKLAKCCNVVGRTQYRRDEILRSSGSPMVKM
jgi:hypothetical protein